MNCKELILIIKDKKMLTPEEIEYYKEAQKPMSIDEKSSSYTASMRGMLGKEDELTNFEITQEEVDRMRNEFGIDIKPYKPKK